MTSLDDLQKTVERLLAEDGCSWDRAQTPQTMAAFLIEEAYEAAAALLSGDEGAVTDELGDVQFVLALVGSLRQQRGQPGLEGAAAAANSKMIERHPHLFGGRWRSWDELKGTEHRRPGDVPTGLPALLRAQKVGRRAAKVGFDWPDASGPRAKVTEELEELDEALEGEQLEAVREELGDLLFSIVNLARHIGVDAESALAGATAKFIRRFDRLSEHVEAAGGSVDDMDASELESTWQQLKGAD